MTIIARFLRWAAVFAVLTLVFWAFAPSEAGAVDSETILTVLTDDGPVVTTMEEYLPHAVAGKMPASFGAEALKAQAVAARTYVLACARHQEADVCTDSACCLAYSDEQALRDAWGEDYDLYWQAVTEAVAATDGEYLTYGAKPSRRCSTQAPPAPRRAAGRSGRPCPILSAWQARKAPPTCRG